LLAGQRDIWTIDPNAPEPKKTAVRVTSVAGVHWNPVWSPDGKYLYYGSDVDGTLNLWRVAMDEDTGSPVGAAEAVGLPASAAGNFAFARSGEMAFVTMTSSYRVLAMPFDVQAGTIGPARQLFGGSQEIATFEPSPDGTMIVYTSNEHIFVTDADGVRIRQLTVDAAKDRAATWSPDGKTLFFFSNRDGGNWHIWSIRADGSGLTRITDNADLTRLGVHSVYTPVASTDGRLLVVQTDGDVSALVHLDRPLGQRLEPLSVFFSQPKWSPDGQLIAAREGLQETLSGPITLFSLRTRRTEPPLASGSSPHWTPDAKKIVYFQQQDVRIFDLASRTTTIVPFTPLAGMQIDLRGVTANLSRDVARLSRDAATLYVRQAIPQSDIWIVRFPAD
jgi:Tol biopolymer transport system component